MKGLEVKLRKTYFGNNWLRGWKEKKSMIVYFRMGLAGSSPDWGVGVITAWFRPSFLAL